MLSFYRHPNGREIMACGLLAFGAILIDRYSRRPQIFTMQFRLRRAIRRLFRPSSTRCDKAAVGEIQTVCGPQTPALIGPTMMHEHLNFDIKVYAKYGTKCGCAGAENLREKKLDGAPYLWDTLRRFWASNAENLYLHDVELVSDELERFRAATGSTIVDVTTHGIRGPHHAVTLQEISLRTNVNVVMGAGYYLDDSVGDAVLKMSVKEIEDRIVIEIEQGVDGIKAGIIGELGMAQDSLTSFNCRVLDGAAGASKRTGAAITIHPPYGVGNTTPPEKGILDVLDRLNKAGVEPQRVIMGHLDRTLMEDEKALKVVGDQGCFLEWDFFGWESSLYHAYLCWKIELLDDFRRIKMIRKAIDFGFLDQIVIAQDICGKARLARYGGHGYAHFLNNIAPYMLATGFTETQVHQILVANPARALALRQPQKCN